MLDATINLLVSEVAALRCAVGLTGPSLFGMVELRSHWPAWGEQRIKAELRQRVGLRFGRGHAVEVSRSDVLVVDQQLESEAQARRDELPYPAPRRPGSATELRRIVARGLGV